MTDDARIQDVPGNPAYGTCAGCRQLKHVTADGLVRDHNRFEATGTVVSPSRCNGSGARYLEAGRPRPVSAGSSGSPRRAG